MKGTTDVSVYDVRQSRGSCCLPPPPLPPPPPSPSPPLRKRDVIRTPRKTEKPGEKLAAVVDPEGNYGQLAGGSMLVSVFD
ncbi:hypothetical protein PAMP_021742 [Pampus punctatissimus]